MMNVHTTADTPTTVVWTLITLGLARTGRLLRGLVRDS